MKAIEHPSKWIEQLIADRIRSRALEAEYLRELHQDQLDIIHREKWLKMFVPESFGGLGLSLPEVLKIEESLAWTDGSVAWVVTLCAGAAWFVGFIDQSLAGELFSDEKVFFAGSGAVTGTAEIIPNGYLLNGNWKYASGSLHATVFTANCAIVKNGSPQLTADGKPLIRAFVMKREEIIVVKTWNSTGMIATGSHSFEAKNLCVPSIRCFEIDAKKALINSPVYRYPFLQLAETTLAVNLSGLATRFFDLAEELISQKNLISIRSLKIVQQSSANLNVSRQSFYLAVNASWKNCVTKKSISKSDLESVSRASQTLVKQSLRLVDQIYPHCGLAAADMRLEINRVWRNLHTVSQHSLFKWQ